MRPNNSIIQLFQFVYAFVDLEISSVGVRFQMYMNSDLLLRSIFWSCQLKTIFYAETFWFCGNGGLLVLVSRRTQRLFKTARTITYAEGGFYALSIPRHLFRPNFACVGCPAPNHNPMHFVISSLTSPCSALVMLFVPITVLLRLRSTMMHNTLCNATVLGYGR